MLQLRASKLDAFATQRAAHDAQRGADRLHSVETRVNSSLLTAVHRYMPLARSGPCFSGQGCLSVRGARMWVGPELIPRVRWGFELHVVQSVSMFFIHYSA